MLRKFWLINNNTKKFWTIRLSGKSYTIVSGRKGAEGRTTTKTFATKEAAETAYIKAISITLGKGYREGAEEPTCIWQAIDEGNMTAVRQFLRADPELIHERGFEGETLLHAAIRNDRCDMAKLFLESGADINAQGGEDNDTPFGLASAEFSSLVKSDVQMVELLLEYKPDLTIKDRWGEPLLYRATVDEDLAALLSKHGIAEDSSTKVIERLKGMGMAKARKELEANPELFKNPRIGELLHFARGGGERVYQFVSFLLDHGVDPNVNCDGNPLLVSVRDPKVARLLLERGTDLKRLEHGGRSLLLTCIYVGAHKEIINDLILFGVKKDLLVLLRLEGVKAVLAAAKKNPALIRELEDPVELLNEVIKCEELAVLLLEHGVDPNSHGKEREAPLRLAVKAVNLKLVRLLLDKGANPVPNDAEANIPLLYEDFDDKKAAEMKAIVDLLVANGALTWPEWHERLMKRLDELLTQRTSGKNK